MKLVYPTRPEIEEWATWVGNSGSLYKYLPIVDARWAKIIEGEFQLTALSQDRNDALRFSARLFYRIIKNHRFVDGNKRSSLVNVYLFLSMNGLELMIPPRLLYHLAKQVAGSDDDQEVVINMIAKRFGEDIKVWVNKD